MERMLCDGMNEKEKIAYLEKEYERLKAIEGENIELKETMINMAKNIFKRDNSLIEIIYKIEKELDRINKKIGE